jgi:hypothetical protein
VGRMSDTVSFTRWDRAFIRLALFLVVVATITVGVVMQNFSDTVFEIQDFQKEGRERSFVQRSISCQILGSQISKEDLPDDCLDPEVTKYYNPDDFPETRAEIAADRNVVVYCGFLMEQGSVIATQEPCKTVLE